jgi:hypothetical protein
VPPVTTSTSPGRAGALLFAAGLAATVTACTCGGGAALDAGPGASPTCLVPGTASTWQLVNGGVAGPASAPSGCQELVLPSAAPSARVQALGVHQVGDVVHFEVPANTGGVSIISQASSGVVENVTLSPGGAYPNVVAPTLLTTPGGATLYNDMAALPTDDAGVPQGAGWQVWFQSFPQMTAAMTLPNTTAALQTASGGYPAGTWSVTVSDLAYECAQYSNCSGGSSGGRYDITVVTQPQPYATGTVDLAFYLVTSALTAQQALTDPHVHRMLSTLGSIYAGAGLCLGTLTFYDVPAWARALYATGVDVTKTGPCDELHQLFTLSKAGNALNFFLVDALIQPSDPNAYIVGLDGTIPAPSSVGGTLNSGAVVNFSDYAAGAGCGGSPNYAFQADGGSACGADVTAYTIAHEGGHWLGLYHTTEQDGTGVDPLSDTPVCQCSRACGVSQQALGCCVDPSTYNFSGSCPSKQATVLFGSNCDRDATTCGGAQSLMFWLLDSPSTGALSSQQGQVMRANPAVH